MKKINFKHMSAILFSILVMVLIINAFDSKNNDVATKQEETVILSESEIDMDNEVVAEIVKNIIEIKTAYPFSVEDQMRMNLDKTPAKPAPTNTDNKPVKESAKETVKKPVKEEIEEPQVVATSVEAVVNGTHYIGDTLSGSDFTITVHMSDGSMLVNPSGWIANPLKLSSASNTITVAYAGVSTNVLVNVTDRPVPPPAPVYNGAVAYTDADFTNLCKIVEAETQGDILSRMLVAGVVVNRVKSRAFPNTITEVIFAGNGAQFTPVADGRFYTANPSALTIEAVKRVLAGEDYTQGATYFVQTRLAVPGSWFENALVRLYDHCGHAFYRTR